MCIRDSLWNYVGWIQGVPEKLLPRTLDETYRLYVAIMMQVGQPDDDSKKLAHAYMSVAEQKGDKTSWLQGKICLLYTSRTETGQRRFVLHRSDRQTAASAHFLTGQAHRHGRGLSQHLDKQPGEILSLIHI